MAPTIQFLSMSSLGKNRCPPPCPVEARGTGFKIHPPPTVTWLFVPIVSGSVERFWIPHATTGVGTEVCVARTRWGWLAASLYVTCGALRLARFNVQIASVEKRYFVGLPIPAGAGVIAATVLLYYWLGWQGATNKHLTMLLAIFTVAALMVSEIRYYSFKEIRFHHRHPFPVLLGLILLIYLTVGTPEMMLFLGIATYALSGPVAIAFRRIAGRRAAAAAGTNADTATVRVVAVEKAPPRH